MATNLMSGTLTDIIKTALEARAKSDRQFALAYSDKNKSLDECVNKIYSALEKLAMEQRGGASGVATCGSDEVLVSAAVHYYDEEDATDESIFEIIKGGHEVRIVQPTAPPQPKVVQMIPKAAPVEDDDDDDDDYCI